MGSASDGEATRPDRKIRVATLLHTTGYGGVDTIVLNWARELDRASFESCLFTFEDPRGIEQPFVDKAATFGMPVRKIPWGRRKPLVAAAKSLAAQLQSMSVDILHCHNPYADFVGALTPRWFPVRTVTTLHAWGESGFRLRVLEWLDCRACQKFDCITVPSRAALEGAVERGIPKARMQMVGISAREFPRVSQEERNRRRAQWNVNPQDVVLVIVGRLYPFKRTALTLEAVSALASKHEHLKLWVVGDGPEETNLRRQAVSLSIEDRVRFWGYVPDVVPLLPLADIQVHSSGQGEGLPLALLEGMSASLPVVATAVGSIPDIVITAQTGILTEPGEVGQLVAAIDRLVCDEGLRSRLALGARELMEQHFFPEQASCSLAAIYRELMGK
jgi:glycosyltransferase involved in cell wall biosynthesis